MSTIPTRRLLVALLVLYVAPLLLTGFVGYRFYRASCASAEQYVAYAPDGPWHRSKARLVIDFEATASPLRIAPHWIFRFQNPDNGNESKRIYVTLSGDRAFSYTRMLDPVPLIGTRP